MDLKSGTLYLEKSSVSSWLMMSSAWPGILLTLFYLYFVNSLGPNLMKNRKPMDLSITLQIYNAVQVIFSAGWLIMFLSNGPMISYIWKGIFNPELFKVDENIETQIDKLVHFYLLSKYVELLDTVFFVLRQKWSQVTFLHVYHHANMAVCTWFYLKFLWGRHIVILSSVNVFIHVLMYSYYLLSSLGPSIRPYLWWKPYITRLQLGQFVLILSFVVWLVVRGCLYQPIFIGFSFFNTSSFLLLFINFYRKAYCSGRSLPGACRPKEL